MKTIAQSLLIAICFGIVTFSTSAVEAKPGRRPVAVAAFQSSFYTTTEGKLNIALDKEQGGTVEIRLTDRNGKVYLAEQVGRRQKNARLRLDVSALPDGLYQVAITNGVTTTVHNLTLSTSQPSTPTRLIALN